MKSLCLSGGGIAGFVHIGVLQALHEKNLLHSVETIVCTSIGSVVGAFLSIGLSPMDIWDSLSEISHDVLEYNEMHRFFSTFGMDSGEYFVARLIDIFLCHGVKPTITFSQVLEKYGKRLVITGTNVSKHCAVHFSPESHGNMRILEAVRISISIPFLFSHVRHDGDVYVDGGIMDNYPIEYCLRDFRKRYPDLDENVGVLGSYIESMKPKTIANIEDFAYNLFACCLKRAEPHHMDPAYTIFIQIEDVSSVDFDIGYEKRLELRTIGYAAAADHVLDRAARMRTQVQAGKKSGELDVAQKTSETQTK
jgi:NTE family protein